MPEQGQHALMAMYSPCSQHQDSVPPRWMMYCKLEIAHLLCLPRLRGCR